MKYCEEREHSPFDWNAFLDKETYTIREVFEARNRARDWVTCACGNQCASIPRHYSGVPEDSVLARLGSEFYGYIGGMSDHICDSCNFDAYGFNWNRMQAKQILLNIELRSAYLLSQINTTTKEEPEQLETITIETKINDYAEV